MSWSHPAFEAVARVLGQRTGLSFAANRQEGAELGMRRLMARTGNADPAAYRELIAQDAAAFDDLIGELTVGETYFFREPGQFEFLGREVIPELGRRRGPDQIIRAWSAGCASGEEAYSLAILFEQQSLGERAHVLGTDISRAALARARQAVYGAWSLRGEGAAVAKPYLIREDTRYRLLESIRHRVAFEHLNLALDAYPSFAAGIWGMDLILCRNVLIYFNPETVKNVVRRLFDSLVPGGWLIAASSDPVLGGLAPFEVVVNKQGVFHRRPVEPADKPNAAFQSEMEEAALLSDKIEEIREMRAGAESSDVRTPPTPLPAAQAREGASVAEARRALAAGEYRRAAALTDLSTPESSALHLRALANLDVAAAEKSCASAAAQHPLALELHYLHALLLADLGRPQQAAQAVRRVIYLDRSLAMAQFTLGSILRQLRDAAGARRAYRNARDLCAALPADEPVPLADGELAGRLAEAADAQLALLETAPEVSP